jgi:oligopeptide/dipeptide ABC transporter ATP-binding protein
MGDTTRAVALNRPGGPDPLLEVESLEVRYPVRGGVLRRPTGWIHAVDGVSFSIARGETLALVGESGSGKTTTGRAIMRVQPVWAGRIRLGGEDLTALRGGALRRRRRRFQMIFQDPYSSLDPRQTVGSIVGESVASQGLGPRSARATRTAELLELVGLGGAFAGRYPHELSGGQRQRVGIARALAVNPELVVCDEPISALDVSMQAQIINLLERLQRELGLTYLFIAHDLAVVRHVADRVAVMYLGKLVELGSADEVYEHPRHPYTTALLSAVPIPNVASERSRERIVLTGEIPRPDDPPRGCRFHPRCWLRQRLGNPEICAETEPPLVPAGGGAGQHSSACHFAERLVQPQAS